MKIIIAAGIAVCLATGSQAQKKQHIKMADLPSTVHQAFQKQYPDATGADWKRMDSMYKVEFRQSGSKHTASFNMEGLRVSHGMEIRIADVPAAVAEAVIKNHPGSKIDDAYKIEKDGQTMFKLELDGSPDKKVMYSADGELLREWTDN